MKRLESSTNLVIQERLHQRLSRTSSSTKLSLVTSNRIERVDGSGSYRNERKGKGSVSLRSSFILLHSHRNPSTTKSSWIGHGMLNGVSRTHRRSRQFLRE